MSRSLILFPHLKVFVFVNHFQHDFRDVGIELRADALAYFLCGSNTQDNLVQGWTCLSGNQTNGGGQTAAVMVNFNVEEQD